MSTGGALASMCAFDIAWSRINKDGDEQKGDYIPVTAFTFEAPRVGEPSPQHSSRSRQVPSCLFGAGKSWNVHCKS